MVFMSDDLTPSPSLSYTAALSAVVLYMFGYAAPLLLTTGLLIGASLSASSSVPLWELLLTAAVSVGLGAAAGVPHGLASARRLREDPYDEWAFMFVVFHYGTPLSPIAVLVCLLRKKPHWPTRQDWDWRKDRGKYWRTLRVHMPLTRDLAFDVIWLAWIIALGLLLASAGGTPLLWCALALVLPVCSIAVSWIVTVLAVGRSSAAGPSTCSD
jgi:hypothetical protein